ncbi:unnamed protein product [Bursaphelenchus xylophilus]|uniref:(pine wood nematode) hypothetical protein n=1 Tax=Bursaphelenchus xylophilus TaxID=6326 RepID=A0A1I7SL60_BURXY|nr:unnamed protein product [Bursaphelenchus xylophilus]CAG9129379.1 unnamed protein product [Bursaphelenchus xylophilus]
MWRDHVLKTVNLKAPGENAFALINGVMQLFLECLIILILAVYSLLVYNNWHLWLVDYDKAENGAKQELIRLAKRVKIQEDKKKRFPEREDIFAAFSLDRAQVESNKKASESVGLNKFQGKCAQFDVFMFPPPPNSSTWTRAIQQGLHNSRYRTERALDACVRSAAIDNLDQFRSAPSRVAPEDKMVLFVREPGNHFPSNFMVFSQHTLGPNGVFLDIPAIFNSSHLPDLDYFNPNYFLQFHIPNADRNKTIYKPIIEKCTTNSTYHNIKCSLTHDPDDIDAKPAKFTLITYSEPYNFLKSLYLSLKVGSIPVIIAENYRNLPLSDMIDWSRILLRLHPNRVYLLFEFLRDLKPEMIKNLQRNGRFVFENHLADSHVLVRAVLSAVRYRMQIPASIESHEVAKEFFTNVPKNYIVKERVNDDRQLSSVLNYHFAFNTNPTYVDKLSKFDTLYEPVWSFSSSSTTTEQFTIILNAFNRDEQLFVVLRNLNGLKYLKSVIVVWCDPAREPSEGSKWPQIHVPVHFVQAKENSLNERFRALDLIETEAVFSMDDDFEVDNEIIEFSYRAWQSNRETLVGPNSRLAIFNQQQKSVKYLTENECMYNIILTSGAFFHRSYLTAYWDEKYAEVREMVDSKKNCEDLAMNFLIQHLSRKGVIKTTNLLKSSGRFEKSSKLSLRSKHLTDRIECLQFLRKFYGYNPLITWETRIDSLHYNHPDNLKCYNDV